LDPEATEIRFRLRATLHSVEGSGTLERGTVDFDPGNGTASGEIVIEARSLATGNRKRDRVMHASVLESEAFPTIAFLPDRFEGSLPAAGVSAIRLHGTLRIHGAAHPMVILSEVRVDAESLTATARFSVPYVTLGMRDPSKFMLRVAKEVEIEIRFTAPLLGSEEG
jgi:polyisoprenoid-binding protein YceI